MQIRHASSTRTHVGLAPAATHPGHSPSPDLQDSPAGRCCGPGMCTSPPRSSTSTAAGTQQQQQHPACSACKHQRRKCSPGCLLAPYFPADKPGSFRNSYRLFGIKNILRFLKMAGAEKRDDCMKSMLFEADVRAGDPVRGAYGVLQTLHRDLFYAEAELDAVRRRLALHGHAAQHRPAPDAPSFLSPVQPALLHTIPEKEQRAAYGYVPNGVKIDADATTGDEDVVMSMQHDEAEVHTLVRAPYNGDGDVLPSSSSSYNSSDPSPCGLMNRRTFGLRFTHG